VRAIRVLVDTTFALRGHSGTGVYLERLIRALAETGVEVVEAANTARRAPGGGGARSALNWATDAYWTTVELPRRARESNVDVLHHPLPAYSSAAGCPQVVTVHDLAFERLPECFDRRYRTYASIAHRRAARSAAAVIAVSETTARDAMARWGVHSDRIVVARHGPGQEPDAARRPRDSEPKHFLYVGDDEPRKNLATLREAHGRYARRAGGAALPLVLAGIDELPDAERLARLYSQAAALVHPSLHEGFGLTPLEAMTTGTPVIAARSPGLTEVCGEAVLYSDPRDPDDLAARMTEIAADAQLRADLGERGRRRAAEFSWARSARCHVEAYTLAALGVPRATDVVARGGPPGVHGGQG
jgi:glycosyltransferase involved in cell wall biosynthesis